MCQTTIVQGLRDIKQSAGDDRVRYTAYLQRVTAWDSRCCLGCKLGAERPDAIYITDEELLQPSHQTLPEGCLLLQH